MSLSLCLVAGALAVDLGVAGLTLGWTHSVEKVLWEEDWIQVPAGLLIAEARVRGSGAGMEPPPEARLRDGAWHWRPAMQPLAEVILRRSGATADWRLCFSGACHGFGEWLPPDSDPVSLKPCPQQP